MHFLITVVQRRGGHCSLTCHLRGLGRGLEVGRSSGGVLQSRNWSSFFPVRFNHFRDKLYKIRSSKIYFKVVVPEHCNLHHLSKLVSKRHMYNFPILNHSMCEYSISKLDFKTQKFHRSQWGFINFSTFKWSIDFKLQCYRDEMCSSRPSLYWSKLSLLSVTKLKQNICQECRLLKFQIKFQDCTVMNPSQTLRHIVGFKSH